MRTIAKKLINIMKIILDIQKVKALSDCCRGIKIKIKMGGCLVISTETAYLKNQCYAFLEKHTLHIDNNDALYLEIILLTQTNQSLAQITMFFSNFKNQRHVTLLSQQQNPYTLLYEIYELQTFLLSQQPGKMNKSSTSSLEDSTIIQQELGKLQILKMGVLVHNFLSKMDPLVSICTKIKQIISWKDPLVTLMVGLVLTVIILYPKMSLFFGGILLYSCRNFIIKRLQKIHKYEGSPRKSVLPDENVHFLQNVMQIYCDLYQTCSQFIFKHDKTFLLYIINILCKTGGLLILLLFVVSVTHLVLILLWVMLLITSPLKQTIKGYATPFCLTFVSSYARMMDNITSSIQNILPTQNKMNMGQTFREFYYYHYQRWNLLNRWHDDDLKYSDKDYECVAMVKKTPPLGWEWVEDWQIDYQQNSDEEGYQYSNDLVNEFTEFLMISTRRRRRWKRCCVKTKSL